MVMRAKEMAEKKRAKAASRMSDILPRYRDLRRHPAVGRRAG